MVASHPFFELEGTAAHWDAVGWVFLDIALGIDTLGEDGSVDPTSTSARS
jgi:hypothetical protein